MNRAKIVAELNEYYLNTLGVSKAGVESRANLFQTKELDSISLLSIVAFVEQQFNIKVPPFEVSFENFANVSRVADVVLEQLGLGNLQ